MHILGGRLDLLLKGNMAVEVKYWTQTYALNHLYQLVDQLLKYQNAGYKVILEMLQTKTDPITPQAWQVILAVLQKAGVNLSNLSQLLPPQ